MLSDNYYNEFLASIMDLNIDEIEDVEGVVEETEEAQQVEVAE